MRSLKEYLNWNKIKNRYDAKHPLSWLFSGVSKEIAENTDTAFRQIFIHDKNWLASQQKRLLDIKPTGPSSTLGELRSYGYLLMTSLNIKPQGAKKGPDFIIEKDNDRIYIETKTNLMCDNFRDKLEENKRGGVTIKVSETDPYGLPNPNKSYDGVTTNAISRICSIKQDEHQLSKTKPSIYWVDIQDLCYCRSIFSELSYCSPIGSFQEEITSGHIWYGLYGWEGAPVFEGFNEVDNNIKRMEHNGRFLKSDKVSAFIFSFPNGTVFMENHRAKNKVPSWFKNRLLYVNRFSIEYSLFNFEHPPLSDYIEYCKCYLERIYDEYKCPQI